MNEKRNSFVWKLAEHLSAIPPFAWVPDVKSDGSFSYLDEPEGRRISMHFSSDGARVEFTGKYPRHESGQEFGLDYGETHRIGCSMARSVSAVASDVQRRFIPRYEEVWQQGLKDLAAYTVQVAEVFVAMERLENVLGCKARWDDSQPTEATISKGTSHAGYSVKVRILSRSGSRFFDLPKPEVYVSELQVRGYIPVEQAAQICLLVQEMGDITQTRIETEES